MRVQYTLPGIIPPPVATGTGEIAVQGPSFRSRIRRLTGPVTMTWKRLLRLDRPGDPAIVGPPPKPASMEVRDVASTRARWRELIERHGRLFNDNVLDFVALGVQRDSDLARLHRMMSLLAHYQSGEDAIVARSLWDAKG